MPTKTDLRDELKEAYATIGAAVAEIARLQAVINSRRPTINAGLPDTYVVCSQVSWWWSGHVKAY